MNGNILVIAIVISIIFFILCIITSIFIYIENSSNNKVNLLFLELDYKQWRIKKKQFIWNKFIHSHQFDSKINHVINSGWVEIFNFFSVLGKEEENKWRESIEYCIKNKTNVTLNSVIDLNKHEKSYWYVDFFYQDENFIQINIKWINKKNKDITINMIDKSSLLNSFNDKYKLFISFNLLDKDDIQNFIFHFSLIAKSKFKISYFIFKKIIVFTICFDNFNKMQKHRIYLHEQIMKQKNRFIINSYCDAISYVDAKDINNENDLVKIITRISFSISKSKVICQPFYFNSKNIYLNEFEEYKESLNNINKIIKNKDFFSSQGNVKKIHSSTIKYLYIYPQINLQIKKNNLFPLIVESTNLEEKIRTFHFEKNLNSQNNTKYLIDINDYDIIKHFNQIIANKNVIYIINFIEFKKPLQIIKLLNLLKNENVNFCFKINKITSEFFSVIENTSPKIIIITNEIVNNLNNKNFNSNNIQIIELILMSERLGIKIIFENISSVEIINNIGTIGKESKYILSYDHSLFVEEVTN